MGFEFVWAEGLTSGQTKYIKYYFDTGFDRRKANQLSEYKSGSTFLKTERGRQALKKYISWKLEFEKDRLEYKVVKMYMIRAFYNPSDIIDAEGYLKVDDLKKLGDLAYCIEGIETDNKVISIDEFLEKKQKIKKTIKKIPFRIKVKLCDREKALEQLSKYMQIMKDILEISGKDGGPIDIYSMSRVDRKKTLDELIKKRNKPLDK